MANEQEQAAKEASMQQEEKKTAEWLQTDSEVKEYLSRFREADVEDFIKKYPHLKASFMYFGKRLGDLPEQHQLSYLSEAEDMLMDIQRKKVFDLMCQWDAELVKFDEIMCIDDFEDWTENPDSCPYITPVSAGEFALYMSFVESENFEINPKYMLYSYEDYRDGDDALEEVPEWFHFENNHTTHGEYLNLPRIRSEKENVYIRLYHQEFDKEIEQKYESGELKRHVPDTRQEISCHYYSHLEQFIIHNESKEVLELFRKMYAYFPDRLIRDDADDAEEGWIVEQVERIMHALSGVKVKIPIEANADWRLGLIDAYEKYEKQQVAQGLHYVYSEYCIRKDLNLASETKKEKKFSRSEYARKQILRGRVLNGEPEDFNF